MKKRITATQPTLDMDGTAKANELRSASDRCFYAIILDIFELKGRLALMTQGSLQNLYTRTTHKHLMWPPTGRVE